MNARNSHLAALGLVRNPFPYTPDAGGYFSTPHLEEQVVELGHCILARKGITLLSAEVGMGKSTLVRRLMTQLSSKNVVCALVFNTFLQGPELLAAVLHDFGLPNTGALACDIRTLNAFLLESHRAGKTCLLIIDDAQNLSADSLELVRLLCNLETDQEKLLQILLSGQPELEHTLTQHSLRQLRSRLVKHARLHGLNSTEIADYVKFRFDCAGSDGSYRLQTDACQLLWQETQGVPRLVNLTMDRCLYGLAARNAKVIDLALMQQAIDDSRVELISAPAAPVAAPATTPVAAVNTAPAVAPPSNNTALAAAPASGKNIQSWLLGALLLGLIGAGVWWQQSQQTSQTKHNAPAAPKPLAITAHKPINAKAPSLASAASAAIKATASTPAITPVPKHDASAQSNSIASADANAAQSAAPSTASATVEAPASSAPNANPAPSNPAAPSAHAGAALGNCQPLRPWPTDRMTISQPLSETTLRLLGLRLSRFDDVCLSVHDSQTWLSWSAPIKGYATSNPVTVAWLQIALVRYGSLPAQEIDGRWGQRTRQALQLFQQGLGLVPTGEIDNLSALLLEKFYAQQS